MASSTQTSKDAEEIVASSPMKGIKDIGPPSLMTQKFIQSGQSGYSFPSPRAPPAFCKEFHFFYGTLMDAQTLAKVLKLNSLPVLVPAKISGYHCMIWGEYPALVGGEPDGHVYGMVWHMKRTSFWKPTRQISI